MGAQELMAFLDEHLSDERGGYYKTASYAEGLPVRLTSPQESSLPSAVGVALLNNAREGLLEGWPARLKLARAGLARHADDMHRWPTAYSTLLLLIDFLQNTPVEVYSVGPTEELALQTDLRGLREQWPPLRVFAHRSRRKRSPSRPAPGSRG